MNQSPLPGDSPCSNIFMCRNNSCVISSHNLHDFLPFLTGKVMISIKHHWLWYSQMLINFEIVISGFFLFHWNKWLLLPKCLKGSSFIVSLSDFYVQLHEELFHVFCRVNFGSSVILLHGSMVEGVWLSSYDKIWHVFHKYKQ